MKQLSGLSTYTDCQQAKRYRYHKPRESSCYANKGDEDRVGGGPLRYGVTATKG